MIRRAIAVGIFVGLVGCRATVPPTPPETVGTLAAGPSTWSAPVHATTDLTPGFQAVEGDDSAGSEVTTVTRAADAGSDAEIAPETVAKASHGF